MSALDFTPLGIANKGRSFLQVAHSTFDENRKPEYNYIDDLGIETGPLLFLIGHATELLCKATILKNGISEQRLKRFKGFSYKIDEFGNKTRFSKQLSRLHNLEFLFRLARKSLGAVEFDEKMNFYIQRHRYFREDHEVFMEPPERPSQEDYFHHLRLLNSNFDRPFLTRYFQKGCKTIPDSEILLVGADFLSETFEETFLSVRKGHEKT